jgi:hypothetical protein
MKEATAEEIRERYRQRADGELLAVAADSSGLTAEAAFALRHELRSRNLSGHEVAEAHTNLKHWREDEA